MEKLGRECKQSMVKEIKERLQKSSYLFVTSFNTMPVAEQEQLRRKLKEIDAALLVVKNRLAHFAFNGLELKEAASFFNGLSAVTLGGRDSITVSKALVDFAAKHEHFKILGAYVDEALLDPTSIKRLAAIPAREILLAQIVGGCKSPIQGLVNSLSATLKKFVLVLEKVREKKV